MRSIKKLLLISLITFSLFELTSFVATKMDLFLVNKTPRIYEQPSNSVVGALVNTSSGKPDIIYGQTERDPWGAWHVKDAAFRHKSACFDIVMEFNEVGARDSSFNVVAEDSVMLLGDSFAEGYGVSFENTSQFLLEKELGFEVLNFGSSGSFGPIQEYLLYKEFRNIPHKGLMVYVLPANDFIDNDSTVWKNVDTRRYRPYFNPEGNPLVPFYFPNAVKRDTFEPPKSEFSFLKRWVKELFWSANAIRTFLLLTRKNVYVEDAGRSYFYDANPIQQTNFLLAHHAILELANDKEVLFVIIPASADIARIKAEPDPGSYKRQTWYQGLKAFEDRENHKISILDLSDHLPATQTDALFLDCDGHWNFDGNKWATQKIKNHIITNNLFNFSMK